MFVYDSRLILQLYVNILMPECTQEVLFLDNKLLYMYRTYTKQNVLLHF